MPDSVARIKYHPRKQSYDLIVAGGGVAGVAAALTANKRGKDVLLLEKSTILGGLATLGLVNYFVPMCNGRGRQIIFGLAEEWLRRSARLGYDTIHDEWKDGQPDQPTLVRHTQRYSPYIFALQLLEQVVDAGVDLMFDCAAVQPEMDGNTCLGLYVENKSGREYYQAGIVLDATGDADILRRSGMPTVAGKNYFTYIGKGVTLDGCRRAVESGNIRDLFGGLSGGAINLYGHGQPDDVPLYSGITVEEVTDYLVRNQLLLLNRLKGQDKNSRDVLMLPMMPQLRTTCRIKGDYTLRESDAYRHFDDSVCAINDFDRRDFLYEIPLRCLTRSGYANLITAGRSISAEGYAWDVTRVIPPAILTGQAAAEAAALSLETARPICDIPIDELQKRLAQDQIMIHFPDELVPKDPSAAIYGEDEGHF